MTKFNTLLLMKNPHNREYITPKLLVEWQHADYVNSHKADRHNVGRHNASRQNAQDDITLTGTIHVSLTQEGITEEDITQGSLRLLGMTIRSATQVSIT